MMDEMSSSSVYGAVPSRLLSDRLIQERLVQDSMEQEKRIQERIVQERLEEKRRIQEQVAQERRELQRVHDPLPPVNYGLPRPYPSYYQPSPLRLPDNQDGAFVPMIGTNPIRGMVTSVYPNVCSQYGSSNVQLQPADFYGGSKWCEVGILMNQGHQPNSIYALEARFIGNSWEFRARDALVGLYIYLQVVGRGPYGSFRTNDVIDIPGKAGSWIIQIQTQEQPYLLYVPV